MANSSLANEFTISRRTLMNVVRIGFGFSVLLAATFAHAKPSETFYRYTSLNPAGHTIVTRDAELPLLRYMENRFGIAEVEKTFALPDGVLATYRNPSGKTITINQPAKQSGVHMAQNGSFPVTANTCDDALLATGLPYAITSADLPYSQTFDTTLATDSGDYRGSSADNISSAGGNDGYWTFTPDESGTYVFTNSATKGAGAPIPDHDFERGFGGIGVWTGNCTDGFTEIGTANSLVGDSKIPVALEAGVTYTVIWEDFFIGSLENSVTLSIAFVGGPVGNDIGDAVDLSDLGWNFSVVGDTTANADLDNAPCVEAPDDGDGHGTSGSGYTGAELWYQLPYVAVGNTYTITVSSDEETTFADSVITLHAYNFTTHQVSQLDCNDDIAEDNRFSSITFTAEPNLIYYAMIESFVAFDQPSFGTFIFEGTAQATSVQHWEAY
jgi:hypothetical protein